MAGKPMNRRALRREYEAAEPADPMEDDAEPVIEDVEEEVEAKPKRAKAKSTKSRAKSSKAAKPAQRMRVVWAVVSDAFKTVATFPYNQKAEAEAKAEELTNKEREKDKGRGAYFIQRVKEPMPEDAPGLGATIPRIPAEATLPTLEEMNAKPEPSANDDDEEEIIEVEDDEEGFEMVDTEDDFEVDTDSDDED